METGTSRVFLGSVGMRGTAAPRNAPAAQFADGAAGMVVEVPVCGPLQQGLAPAVSPLAMKPLVILVVPVDDMQREGPATD